MPENHGSHTPANELFTALVGTANANLPNIDFSDDQHSLPWKLDSAIYQPVQALTADIITEKKVGGNGIFDVMMSGFAAHLEDQYQRGYITQANYSQVYTALTSMAMQSAVQFALGKDQAFWGAARAQAEAITAKINLEAAKIAAQTGMAQFALTKLKLASEDVGVASAEYQLDEILPKQKVLVTEQGEAQHAQTSDKKIDGTTDVGGVLGKQRQLYDQQITSYKADVKHKAAKMIADMWVTMKTMDESIEPSKYFEPKILLGASPTPEEILEAEESAKALDDVFREIRKMAIGEGTNSIT